MDSNRWAMIKELFNETLDLPESERTAFLNTCDADLRGEVEQLLRADRDAGQFIDEPAIVDIGLFGELPNYSYLGTQIDSFKIVKEIGHGGMGTVYLAEHADESFTKHVALKLIKRGMDTGAVLKRFVMERRILAQLQHPNLANFIDGGSTADGLPYFVMEYVNGTPINKFADARGLSINQRIELFQKVCSAISYAHQNLVVHRDIKPSNILVTENGTPKLLDFGIAKLLHPEWSLETAEATATMFRIMTPEYASPEQIRGLPITTASDVYSLGVVLYELLSGERPYKIESRLPEEIAQHILTVEPIKPSSVVSSRFQVSSSMSERETFPNDNEQTADGEPRTNPKSKIQNLKSLQGDLDNIILKALRKEPERRYASVQEFSEDIRRHLAGLPVTATADTVSYRFKKFAARHRGGVFAGGLVLLTLLVATGVTSWQAYVARQERDKAELRFNQVRKLANTILFDYHDGIAELAGSTPVREKMVKDSLEYLDNLANESSGDADLQRELAAAYRKVGDIQGSYGGTNIGNTGAAFESYQKALSIQTKLVEANPANIEDRRMQARLMIDIAHQYENAGDFQSSESNTRKATEIFNGIVNEQPNETKSRSDLARALWTLASAVRAKGDLDGAITQYDQAARIYEKLAEEKSDERKFSRNAALTYKNIGGVIELKKDYSAALEYYRKALIIDMKNAEEEPENATSQLDLSFSYGSIASASMNLGNLEEALDYRNKALSIQEKIAAADAKNVFAKAALARTFRQLGDLHEKRIKFDEALSNYRKSLQIFESLSNSDPKNSNLKAQFGDICSIFGNFLLRQSRNPHKRLERLREAQTFQKRGFEIFQTLKSQNALEKRYDEQFGEVQNGLKQTESELAKIRQ